MRTPPNAPRRSGLGSIATTAAAALALAGCAAPARSAPSEAALPAAEQPALDAIVAAVSTARIEADIRTLAGFGTRHTLSETASETRGIGAARRWLAREFEAIAASCGGCIEVTLQRTLEAPSRRIPEPVEIVNVLAIQRGTSDPERWVVMSGDIDSRASDALDATSDAPGANDNASGLAGTLEAARVLAGRRFAATIVYAGLSGEEQGLFGGQHLARMAKERGLRIEAVLNNDMIGNIQGQDGVVDDGVVRVFSEGVRADETPGMARTRRFSGGEVDSPSRNLARYIDRLADRHLPHLDALLVYRLDRFGRGGHHKPFNDVGYPAVRLMEAHEDYRRQHQDIRVENGIEYGDVVEEVEFDFAAKVTALNAITLAALAWAPPPPEGVRIEGAVEPSTTLRWQRIPRARAPELAGYRVHWRRTDQPQWEWSRYVGDVDHARLENVVIDNYFFGVSSVSHAGYESPVVFPGAIGAFAPAEWSEAQRAE